ncbi:ABC transporter substrate-binding protein [Kalamiella sp. sgz302252]|uniref:ABC transporter substrate-binding protein n=1 Tax=Pantoea sp. sgz302252 TaxID=3341827 RepID=UPI0036D21E70
MDINRRRTVVGLAATAICAALPHSAFSAEEADRGLFLYGKIPPSSSIHKILSAGAPGDPLLLALAPEKLLGLSFYSFSRPGNEFMPEKLRQLPETGRLAGMGNPLSLEKLLRLKPDLIIDCGMTGETYRSLAQRIVTRTGIPWVLVDGRLKHSVRQLQQLGTLLGVAERAKPLVELAERILHEAFSFAASHPVRLRFYSARGINGLQTGLQGSLHTEAAELLGMQNVAVQPGQAHLVQVSLEQLLAWQPEVIITQDVQSWRHITTDPIWRGIKAVAQNQVLLFPQRPFGWLDGPPGVNRLAGLRMLQARFDAEVAKTLQQDLAQFFRLFYHSEPDAAQWRRLMSPA